MYDYDEDSKLDNGGPAFFGIVLGFFEILWGLVELAVYPWKKNR